MIVSTVRTPALARAAALALASLLFAAPQALATTLTGSGKSATEQRAVAGFKGMSLAIPAKVEIVQGGAEGATITADDNVLGEIETVVERDVLRIRWRDKDTNLRTRSEIRITLNARNIESITVAGSGDVSSSSLVSKQLAIRVAGSGDVRVAGKADSIAVSISGSGDVDARKLEAQRAAVRIAGSGDALVWAREALEVHVAGSGDVRYYGDPKVAQRVAGSGSVRRAGASPG